MWKLTIEDDEGKQTSLPLAQNEYGVGRGQGNVIRLTDRNISRKHAALKKNEQGWVLHDFQSYNGTYVNGTRVVSEQHLSNGDIVQLGDYRLEFTDEALAQATVPVDEGSTPGGAPLAPHQRPNRLVVVVGPTPGTEFPLNREHYTIGRAEDTTISINHASISRLHAELISIGNGRYEIVDKQSANGIRINGVELKRGILEAGDALELGDVRLRFVGAGKTFRAGADQSQQLSAAAVSGLESISPSVRMPPVDARGGIAKYVALGMAIGVLILTVIFFFALKAPAAQPPAAPAAAAQAPPLTPDATNQIITDAKAAAAKGDLDGAHEKIKTLADGAPALSDPAVADIEGKWADMMFGKVNNAADPGDQRKLLNVISTSPNVDADRRKKAVDMIGAIDAATPDPQAVRAPQAAFPQVPGPMPNGAAPAGTFAVSAATAKAVETGSPPVTAAAPAAGLNDYDQQRKRLEPRVWSGKASEEEIRLLKAICSHQGDHACRNRANAMLKAKAEGN
jgi:pSer/pThr/pTyr-binding forkhead associated (FHA) protein